MRRKRTAHPPAALLVLPVLLAAALAFSRGVDALDQGRDREAVDRLTQAIRRGCVTCYAAEGRYPESLDYLIERYGLQLDQSRYAVFYEPTGANLMPQITVLECQP